MMKNDYRRALIMLRSHAAGYSGHVRLERRTLTGSMYASIRVPPSSGTLCASLIRRGRRGKCAAAKIGELRRDGRGQANLVYIFDPRNIDGHPLEDYWLIAIVSREPSGCCEVVLTGNLDGAREIRWDEVREAACSVCAVKVPAFDLYPVNPNRPASPDEGPQGLPTPEVPPPDIPASPDEGPQGLPTPEVPPSDIPASPDEGVQVPLPNIPISPDEGPQGLPMPEVPPSDIPASPDEGVQVPLPNIPISPDEGPQGLPTPEVPPPDIPASPDEGVQVPPMDVPASPDGGGQDFPTPEVFTERFSRGNNSDDYIIEETFRPRERTALEVLGLNPDEPWPGVSESLREMFASNTAAEPMLNDGYTYVSAPMPRESGYDRAQIGVKAENGRPVSVSYALPSRYSPEPPAGLDGYVWKGGASDGWWIIETDAATGKRLE